jgi:O-acetyl-ADP-ribose deacetylase (regulator of RNase III)
MRFAVLAASRWLVMAGSGIAAAQERPAPSAIELQCRKKVERRHPPGSLSRARGGRQKLIEACIANGGRLP